MDYYYPEYSTKVWYLSIYLKYIFIIYIPFSETEEKEWNTEKR